MFPFEGGACGHRPVIPGAPAARPPPFGFFETAAETRNLHAGFWQPVPGGGTIPRDMKKVPRPSDLFSLGLRLGHGSVDRLPGKWRALAARVQGRFPFSHLPSCLGDGELLRRGGTGLGKLRWAASSIYELPKSRRELSPRSQTSLWHRMVFCRRTIMAGGSPLGRGPFPEFWAGKRRPKSDGHDPRCGAWPAPRCPCPHPPPGSGAPPQADFNCRYEVKGGARGVPSEWELKPRLACSPGTWSGDDYGPMSSAEKTWGGKLVPPAI